MTLLYYLIIILIIIVSVYLFWRYIYFFRNPSRQISYDPKSILSPADGTILYCKKIEPGANIFSIKKNNHIKLDDLMFTEDKSLKQSGWLIGIVMTLLDVHYNRAPIDGFVKKIMHDFPDGFNKNKFMISAIKNIIFNRKPLWKNCEYIVTNERASYIFKNEKITLYVTQIADRWIDKIVSLKNNTTVKQGEVFGLIKMGSQVDIFVPDSNGEIELLVREKQKVKAGITKLMKIK